MNYQELVEYLNDLNDKKVYASRKNHHMIRSQIDAVLTTGEELRQRLMFEEYQEANTDADSEVDSLTYVDPLERRAYEESQNKQSEEFDDKHSN